MVHTNVEAAKSKICNWQAGDPGEPADGVSPSLKAGEDDVSAQRHWAKRENSSLLSLLCSIQALSPHGEGQSAELSLPFYC